jgi:hypothetical protein
VQLCGQASEMWGATAWEHTIRLFTGRTYQIRAQMAALEAPLHGDTLYHALHRCGKIQAVAAHDELQLSRTDALDSTETCELDQLGRHSPADWIAQFRSQADQPLGLQASSLAVYGNDLFGQDPFHLENGDPWWRVGD